MARNLLRPLWQTRRSEETQRAACGIRLTVVKPTDHIVKGLVALPKRWIAERTVGWVNRARNLAKDFETSLTSSRACFKLLPAFLLVRRIASDYKVAA